jgi:hypothetical protein
VKPETRSEAIAFLEKQILGSVLNHPDANGQKPPTLPGDLFFDFRHKTIARAINAAQSHDVLTVINYLTQADELEAAGGAWQVSGLTDEAPLYREHLVQRWIEQLRQHSGNRKLRDLLLAATNEMEGGDDPTKILNGLTRQSRHIIDDSVSNALAESIVSITELFSRPPARPPFLVSSLIPEGSLNLLSGLPGVGKSFFCLQLAAALSIGSDIFGLRCTEATSLYMGAELPDFTVDERARTIQALQGMDTSKVKILAYPNFPYQLDFPNPKHVADIIKFLTDHPCKLLMIDPLARVHSLDENKADHMKQLIECFDEIRSTTGTAILLSHHESSKGLNIKQRDDVDAPRGSSVLSSHPTLTMRLAKHKSGFLQLRVTKTTFGEKPKPIWLSRLNNGMLEISEGPTKSSDEKTENASALQEYLLDNAGEITLAKAMEVCPYPRGESATKTMLRSFDLTPRKLNRFDNTWIRKENEEKKIPF